MRIALAQYNPIIGDLEGNASKTIEYIDKARENECDLVVFPELSLIGYPPRDLLLRKDFITKIQTALERIASATHGIGVLIGSVTPIEKSLYLHNSAILLEDGDVKGLAHKALLPNYDVFEESRYFKPAEEVKCLEFRGVRMGLTICEDIWNDRDILGQLRYSRNVLAELYEEKPQLFINMSASPYHYSKHKVRMDMAAHYSSKYGIPFIYVNQVGGNDELVFDGSSMVFDANGRLVLHGRSFEEDLVIFNTDTTNNPIEPVEEDISWMYRGAILGMRDYFHKTGFKKAVLGLSGGVDSALVAVIATEALGKKNVLGVSMPSRYTSQRSKDDARQLAENLGIEYRVISIENIFKDYIKVFNGDENTVGDLAEENIQARIRGNLWMFISNREGKMLVSASNKSEIAVGYSTLYGDMCGGLSVIGDISKSRVYKICRYINRDEEIIPNSILVKPPSAELRPDQKDEDSLPPYDILDPVMQMYIEEGISVEEIIQRGYERDVVYKIVNMIDRAEYKRRQAPMIIKLTEGSFGIGRRMPIVKRFSLS
jgi:NAD+ synthase (glutamine-hydrolysing)